jgi:hypothetical protein
MKYFTVDKKFNVIHPNVCKWYSIPIEELNYYYPDGNHRWFPHLASKSYFTVDMFWELLNYTIETYPDFDPKQSIFQTGLIFGGKHE